MAVRHLGEHQYQSLAQTMKCISEESGGHESALNEVASVSVAHNIP